MRAAALPPQPLLPAQPARYLAAEFLPNVGRHRTVPKCWATKRPHSRYRVTKQERQ